MAGFGVAQNFRIARDQGGGQLTCGRDKQAIGGIAMKRLA
jgi:hypothetical protein